jgi:hypothetical protein
MSKERWSIAMAAAMGVAVVGLALPARASELLFSNPSGSGMRGGVGDGPFDGIGLKFTTKDTPLTVTALGIWDKDGDGLQTNHVVTLYREQGATLIPLGNVHVPAGTGGTPATDSSNNTYRVVALSTPITLAPYTPYRLCDTQGGLEPFHDCGGFLMPSPYVGYDTLACVGYWSLNNNSGYIGPNLLFDPGTPTPRERGLVSVQAVTACSYDNTYGVPGIWRRPEKTIDGVELMDAKPLTAAGPLPTQLTDTETFWASGGGEADPAQRCITWDFGQSTFVESMAIWNWNWFNTNYSGWAVKALDVYASNDNITYRYIRSFTLNRPGATNGAPAQVEVFGSPFRARYVKFANMTNFVVPGDGNPNPYRVALGEVAFYSVNIPGTQIHIK